MGFSRHVVCLWVICAVLGSAAATAARSRVIFLSNPPGATVTDATLGELGTTPFELRLKRGTELDCTFSKPGFQSRSVTSVVDALRVEVRGDLTPRPATTVRLGVTPRLASVRLSTADGTEIYSGEGGRVHTLPGELWGAGGGVTTFHVEVSAPGYRPLHRALELTKHEQHEVTLELTERSTVLNIRTQPEGAKVSSQFLGDLGVTPLEARVSLVELMRARSRAGASQGDPARMMLTFSKPGHRTLAHQVAVDFDRAENEIEITLEP